MYKYPQCFPLEVEVYEALPRYPMKYKKTQNTMNILLKKKNLTHHLGHQVLMTKEINVLGIERQ